MPAEKRPFSPDDLYAIELITGHDIAPDGTRVVYAVQRVDRRTEKKYSNLWLSPVDSPASRPFTHGDHVDGGPRWSPDGRHILFLSNRGDERQPQLHLIPVDGGEARAVTDLKGHFGAYQWSPDSRSVVFMFRRRDAAALEREEDEQKKKLGVVYRRYKSLNYKFDGVGYLTEEKWHIWRLDVDSGECQPLTDGDYDETEPCWSPDGERILFISNRSEAPDLDHDATELYTIPAEGGEMTMVPAHQGRKRAPAFSPDGRWISYLGRVQPGKWYQNSSLYVVPAAGGTARNVTAHLDLHLDSVTLMDLGGSPPLTTPVWSPDSARVFSQITTRGDQHIVAVDVQATPATATTVVAGPGIVGPFQLNGAGRRIAYTQATFTDPGQLWVVDLASGERTRVTHLNETFLAERIVTEPEELTVTSADGTAVPGWVLYPPDFDPAGRYPTIVEIHGGPQTQYGRALTHEFQVLAGQGYVVFFSNPRGSQGYGEAFAGAIYNNWGTIDFDDVMALTDYAAAQPYVDAARLGVTGGSYGGFMTSMIIGRSDRFKAAIAQRVVSNWFSFYGSCDFNWGAEYLVGCEKRPWDDVDNYWRQSPMKYIGGATTPTLVIHSENDYRCAQEQGEQLFVALRKLGVETELLLFPEESHGLSRTGRVDRRVVRLEAMVDWFDRYLK